MFVAEDEDNVRALTESLLEDAGYLVLSARDGEEALARMRGSWHHAVAIIDLVMPRMDGLSLIAAMKADEELSHIPVIAMSARHDAPQSGVDRFVKKPFRPNELLAAVTALCR